MFIFGKNLGNTILLHYFSYSPVFTNRSLVAHINQWTAIQVYDIKKVVCVCVCMHVLHLLCQLSMRQEVLLYHCLHLNSIVTLVPRQSQLHFLCDTSLSVHRQENNNCVWLEKNGSCWILRYNVVQKQCVWWLQVRGLGASVQVFTMNTPTVRYKECWL